MVDDYDDVSFNRGVDSLQQRSVPRRELQGRGDTPLLAWPPHRGEEGISKAWDGGKPARPKRMVVVILRAGTENGFRRQETGIVIRHAMAVSGSTLRRGEKGKKVDI